LTGTIDNDGWYYSVFNENIRGIYCDTASDDANFIVKDLYENCEQVNNIDTSSAICWDRRVYSDIKVPWYNYRWFVKPRMRIDSNYAKHI